VIGYKVKSDEWNADRDGHCNDVTLLTI
jgi:hypothetical protein